MSSLPRSAPGFTLVELLVALALLSMASLLIVEGLRFGLRAWDSVNTRLSRSDAVATAQQVLRGRLQQVVPVSPDAVKAGGFALLGDAAEVRFVAPGPHTLAGHMLRYRLFLDKAGAGALRLSWSDSQGLESPQGSEVLLDKVSDLQLDYFSKPGRDAGAWSSSWTQSAEAPQLVRVRLHFAGGADGDWPALIVKPLRNTPADCHFDLVSRRCR